MGCLLSRDAVAAAAAAATENNIANLLTLKDIEAQQARLLELVSLENFKTQLAGQMAENMNAYMDKHCDVVRGRISKKLEADVNNIEMRIINAVIDNVTTQVLRRLEHKVVLLEKQFNEEAPTPLPPVLTQDVIIRHEKEKTE